MANNLNKTISFGDLFKTMKQWAAVIMNAPDKYWNDIEDILISGANKIRNTAIRSMKTTQKSAVGIRRGKGRYHYPSLPYNPPAIDYGELVRSIAMEVKHGAMEVEVGATTGAPYAKFLEEGTSKMRPRPWLEPASEPVQERIMKQIIKRTDKLVEEDLA